jgi:hypothetical protein
MASPQGGPYFVRKKYHYHQQKTDFKKAFVQNRNYFSLSGHVSSA